MNVIPLAASSSWYRIEIDFPGELDEAFGVAANKQGVRMKTFVIDAIKKAIGDDLASIKADIEEVQAQRAAEKKAKVPSLSEMKAAEADAFQADQLDANLTEEQKAQVEENLRGLAVGLSRENETEEEAFQRVKASRYIIRFHHDKFLALLRRRPQVRPRDPHNQHGAPVLLQAL